MRSKHQILKPVFYPNHNSKPKISLITCRIAFMFIKFQSEIIAEILIFEFFCLERVNFCLKRTILKTSFWIFFKFKCSLEWTNALTRTWHSNSFFRGCIWYFENYVTERHLSTRQWFNRGTGLELEPFRLTVVKIFINHILCQLTFWYVILTDRAYGS